MNLFWSFLSWFRQALFPHKCLVCRREGLVLCVQHQSLPPAVLPPLNQLPALDGLHAVTHYANPSSQALIKWFKFNRHQAPLKIIAEQLQERIPWQQWPRATIIPLPLHWWRQHQRGFNQSTLMAQLVAEFLEAPYDEKSFKRIKLTQQQARLNKRERQKNMAKAFAWKSEKQPPETVILLDDVCTTGSTLQAAAKALKKAGVKKVIAVVFAYQSLTQ